MSLSLNDFAFSLETLFGNNPRFLLKKVAPWYEFDEIQSNPKKQLGHKYTVANMELVVKITVKVADNQPVISNEDLLKNPTPVYVTFNGSRASFYGRSLYDCDLSVTAEKAVIVPVAARPAVKAQPTAGFAANN
jgi:hypothetical protein